jgi:signal transduction histidine kinase
VGLALVAELGPPLSIGLGTLERRRLGIVDLRPVASGHQPASAGPAGWLRVRLAEAATWREVAYAAFVAAIVPVAYVGLLLLLVVDVALLLGPWLAGNDAGRVSVGVAQVTSARQAIPYAVLGVVLLPLWPYLAGLAAAGQAAVARALLGDGGPDTPAVREVARSRARLVDAYEAERRRIERDLHDGAQHQLTSLTLQLGMARLDMPEDSPAAAALGRAHEQAKELMVALRNVVHGIHPQSLTDLGLLSAVRELAAQLPIPVTVTAAPQWSERLPERVESTAYFVVSEALTNIAKHRSASRADVSVTRTGNLLIMEIRDNGTGGAEPAGGTGLTGLSDRVAAVGGRLLLASPSAGPTVIRAELPCHYP